MSPLDEFANSPRRFRNDSGSEVVSSSLVKLGPGLVATRPNGAPGEATFVTLDATADPVEPRDSEPTPDTIALRTATGAGKFVGVITPSVRPEIDPLVLATAAGVQVIRIREDPFTPPATSVEILANTLGFFGATAQPRPVISASSLTLALDVATALETLGLIELTA